jgi:hypothetical protein
MNKTKTTIIWSLANFALLMVSIYLSHFTNNYVELGKILFVLFFVSLFVMLFIGLNKKYYKDWYTEKHSIKKQD